MATATAADRTQRGLAALARLPPSSLPATALPLSQVDTPEVARAYKTLDSAAHQQTAAVVCEQLGVDPRQGLSFSAAATRADKYGQNALSAAEKQLVGSEQWANQRHLQSVVVIRTDARSSQPQALEVAPNTLVVGDIVVLEAGDRVPADLRICSAETVATPQSVFSANGDGWKTTTADLATTIDASVPNGLGPLAVTSSAVKKSPLAKANNMALKGNTVLNGRLVGVVVATGSRCVLAQTKDLGLPVAPKLARGTDKKKLFKVAAKLEVLGMKIRNPEAAASLCGCRNMTVIISVQRKLLPALNVALPKLVAQGFHIMLLLRPDVDAAKDIAQLPNLAIGKPIDFAGLRMLPNAAAINVAVDALPTVSVLLATGPDMVAADVVKAVEERLREPTVIFSDSITDRQALERATLGCCMYTATGGLLQVAHAVLGSHGLERLVLYLKVLKESVEVFGRDESCLLQDVALSNVVQ